MMLSVLGKPVPLKKVGEDGRYMANNHIVDFIGIASMQGP
jgi:stage V sporulation protein D (sporulation-specific penicillin-binding protein)